MAPQGWQPPWLVIQLDLVRVHVRVCVSLCANVWTCQFVRVHVQRVMQGNVGTVQQTNIRA